MAVVAVMDSAFVALSYVGVGLGAGVGKLSFLIGVFQRKRPSLTFVGPERHSKMSALGHQRRFDVGGTSAIAPIATKMSRRDERRKGPRSDIRSAANCGLFDHLVGNGEQPWRKAEAECLGSVEVDHELEFDRLHDR